MRSLEKNPDSMGRPKRLTIEMDMREEEKGVRVAPLDKYRIS